MKIVTLRGVQMFALIRQTQMLLKVSGPDSIEAAEEHSANGTTYNDVIDSNDSPPGNNQQQMTKEGIPNLAP